MIRVKDLPQPRPGRKLPDGGFVEARQPFLRCRTCGGQYSANPGDYWNANPETIMRCCDRPMALVDEVITYVPVTV
jgi:hypothetical protein